MNGLFWKYLYRFDFGERRRSGIIFLNSFWIQFWQFGMYSTDDSIKVLAVEASPCLWVETFPVWYFSSVITVRGKS